MIGTLLAVEDKRMSKAQSSSVGDLRSIKIENHLLTC